jgi:hypothetical protein
MRFDKKEVKLIEKALEFTYPESASIKLTPKERNEMEALSLKIKGKQNTNGGVE